MAHCKQYFDPMKEIFENDPPISGIFYRDSIPYSEIESIMMGCMRGMKTSLNINQSQLLLPAPCSETWRPIWQDLASSFKWLAEGVVPIMISTEPIKIKKYMNLNISGDLGWFYDQFDFPNINSIILVHITTMIICLMIQPVRRLIKIFGQLQHGEKGGWIQNRCRSNRRRRMNMKGIYCSRFLICPSGLLN